MASVNASGIDASSSNVSIAH